MNVFAKFDETQSMILQDIKETKRYGQTDGRSFGRSDGRKDNVKIVYPPTNKVCRGYNNYQKQWKICTIKESLIYSTLILSLNCPSELTHTNPSTVSDPQISKSYCNFK